MNSVNKPPNASQEQAFIKEDWWSISKDFHDIVRNGLIACTVLAASKAIGSGKLDSFNLLGVPRIVTSILLIVLASLLLATNVIAVYKRLLMTWNINAVPREKFAKIGYFTVVLILLVMLFVLTANIVFSIVQVAPN
jgi:hypothetical protein